MLNKSQKVAAVMLSATVAAVLLYNQQSGVHQTTATTAAAKQSPVTLKIMLWGTAPNQLNNIVQKFEQQTKSTLNTNLNFIWTPQSDYANNIKLKLAAGQPIDLDFDAQWMNLTTFAQAGDYYNLASFFNNPKYPGLKKAFDPALLKENEFIGPDGKLGIYGLPLTQYYGDINTVFYRTDLAKKYGIGSIQTYAQLLRYFSAIKAHSPNMIPFVEKNDGTYSALDIINAQDGTAIQRAKAGLWSVSVSPSITATVYIKNKKVVSASVSGENEKSIIKFPKPFNTLNFSNDVQARKWHDLGYTEADPITRSDNMAPFTSGAAAATMGTLSNYNQVLTQLNASIPSAKLGVFIVDPAQRKMAMPGMVSDFRAWNFLAIPKSSHNLVRTMQFLNWMFLNSSNHDLFEMGIQGKNWVPVGKSQFKFPKGINLGQNYNLPGYELTWNPHYIRLPDSIPANDLKYYHYLANANAYLKTPLAGFAFNQTPVANAVANPDFAKIPDMQLPFTLGMVAKPWPQLVQLQQQWDKNSQLQSDISTIKAEVIKQVNAFLKQ